MAGASDRHYMNPQHGAHFGAGSIGHEGRDKQSAGDVKDESGQHKAPSIHIHSHSKGHTVHIMHHNGQHEQHEHSHGDAEGIAGHIHQHLGGQPANVASEGAAPPMEEEEFS